MTTVIVLCKDTFRSSNETDMWLQQSEIDKSCECLPKLVFFRTEFPVCNIPQLSKETLSRKTYRGNFSPRRSLLWKITT